MALAGAAGIAAFGALGVLQRAVPAYEGVHWMSLERERTPAALWAALLLGAAAVAWGRAALPGVRWLLVGMLALMTADEWSEVHEGLGGLLYTEWQLVYAPLVLAAGVAALLVLRRWGLSGASGLLLAGGACWAVAQGLEAVQWWGDTAGPRMPAHYAWWLVSEEVLEMTGSLLMLLAPLHAPVRSATVPSQRASLGAVEGRSARVLR